MPIKSTTHRIARRCERRWATFSHTDTTTTVNTARLAQRRGPRSTSEAPISQYPPLCALARDHPPTSAPPNDSSPDPPVDWKKRLSQSRKDAKDWSRNKLEAHTYPLAPLRLGERSSPHLSTTQRFVARPSGRLKERTLAKSQSRKGLETKQTRSAHLPLGALARDNPPTSAPLYVSSPDPPVD